MRILSTGPGGPVKKIGASIMRIVTALLLALTASAVHAAPEDIADNAPDSYTVQKGDTLWGISGRFLKQPTRWPEVWRMNRDQIRNPHLIYPGQVVVLDRLAGTLSIGSQDSGVAGGTIRLSPQVYSTPVDNPIASVPMDVIRPFLTEPLVDEQPDSPNLPSVVAVQQERIVASLGDTVFARYLQPGIDNWQIYRRAAPIRDPRTNQILAFEAQYVGAARTTSLITPGVSTALQVIESREEVNISDRMIPMTKVDSFNYPPHAPPAGTNGHIATIYGGVGETGRYGVVTFNIGKQQGLEPGHVFAIYRSREPVVYRSEGRPETHIIPEARYGIAYVFRVFNRISYALIMNADVPVRPGDAVRAP